MPDLFDYQIEGAAFSAEREFSYNADQPGLGKSAQAITAALQKNVMSARVICPASVRENWHREFIKFGGEFIDLQVLSYEGATALTKPKSMDLLIVDEAHYLKGRDTKRTQAILGENIKKGGLISKHGSTIFLSGTPTPNNPSELWPALYRAFPGALMPLKGKTDRPMEYWEFVHRFCTLEDNGFGTKITGGKRLEELRQRIKPFFIRRRKNEVQKDLPEMIISDLVLEPKKVSTTLRGYESDWSARIAAVLEESGVEGLAHLGPHVAILRRLTGMAKVKPVFDFVMESFADGLDKIVLFAYHRDVIGELEALFVGAGVGCVTLDGSTAANKRQSTVDRFQEDPNTRVFIGQVTAAGTGITLTAASNLLFVEYSWVPTENWQAAQRIHRIGQTRGCLIRFVKLAGSLDEKITEAARKKTDVIRQLGF